MRRFAASAAVCLLLLTGCFTPSNPSETPRCIEYVCLAAGTDADRDFIQQRFGLRQLTDDGLGESHLSLEGDFVVWQANRYNGTHVVSDVVGYDFFEENLVAIDVEGHYFSSWPVVAGGRVAYTREPKIGAADFPGPGRVMLWDSLDGSTRVVESGLNGTQQSVAFDGEWVLLTNRGSNANETGYWAVHVDTGERVHLYTPHPRGRLPDGSHESIPTTVAQAIGNGKAYYILSRSSADEESKNATVYEVDLATKDSRVVYTGGIAFVEVDVIPGGLILAGGPTFGSRPVIWRLDLLTGDATRISTESGSAGSISTRDTWFTYAHNQGVTVIDAATSHRIEVITKPTPDDYKILGLEHPVTDGNRIVVQGIPGYNEEHRFTKSEYNLYWMPLE